MHNKLASILILSFFLFTGIDTLFAQVFTTEINRTDLRIHNPTKQKKINARTEADEPLKLPFWDDFSWSIAIPSDSLWEVSNVEISPGSGLDAPSFNVARFDGIKLDGSAYSFNFVDFESGDTDTLTSRPIDLSGLTNSSNVYLSFFYQKQGNGELPEDEDGFRVDFLSTTVTDTTWVSAIPPNTINGENISDDKFHTAIVKVENIADVNFFHEAFQFRIISTGRKTGPYDTWNIDYVYLNKNRNDADTVFVDRALSKQINTPLLNFTSIPAFHLKNISTLDTDTIRTSVHNLSNIQPVLSGYAQSEVTYIDALTEDTISFFSYKDSLRADTRSLSQVKSFKSKDVLSKTPHDFSQLTDSASYAEVNIKLHIITDDDTTPLNFYLNDTLTAKYIFEDYYAYDDGTAEKGAGVNSENNQIAYQFPNLDDSGNTKLTGIDFFFPQTIGYNQVGQQIKLKIWDSSEGKPNEEISSRFLNVPKIDSLNKFYRVEIIPPIAVTDTFYIGWEQLSSNRIIVGLDKNIDSGDKIWLNVVGEWEPNNNQIVGSLMMRPVFGIPDEVVSGLVEINNTQLYPNPSERFIHIIQDAPIRIKVYSLSGKEINPIINKQDNSYRIDFANYPNGVYLITLITNSKIITERIVLRK